MKLEPGVEVSIVSAEIAGDYRLRLLFSDGHSKIVDFSSFLASSLNPETRQFLSVERFNAYRLEWGNLIWGDYAMCFPIEDLYEGRLAGSRALAVAEKGSEYGAAERRAAYRAKKQIDSKEGKAHVSKAGQPVTDSLIGILGGEKLPDDAHKKHLRNKHQ